MLGKITDGIQQIGNHIRRGDLAKEHLDDIGYTNAIKDYIASAMNYFFKSFSIPNCYLLLSAMISVGVKII